MSNQPLYTCKLQTLSVWVRGLTMLLLEENQAYQISEITMAGKNAYLK